MSGLYKTSLLLLLVTIAFVGCKKKDPEPEKVSGLRLKTYTIPPKLTSTYSYNSQGKVSSVVMKSQDGVLLQEDLYTYANGELSEINTKLTDRNDGVYKLAINKKFNRISATQLEVIEKHLITFTNGLQPFDVILTFDPQTKLLTKITAPRVGSSSENRVWERVITSRERGNIGRTRTYMYENGVLTTTLESVFQYDDKPNPFYQLGDPTRDLDYFSPNNCISSRLSQPNSADQITQRNYTYNDQGYPVNKSIPNGSDYPYTYEAY